MRNMNRHGREISLGVVVADADQDADAALDRPDSVAVHADMRPVDALDHQPLRTHNHRYRPAGS